MKLVFVIASLKAGGAERVVANLSNALHKNGHDVRIVLFDNTVFYDIDPNVGIETLTVESHGIRYIFDAVVSLRRKLMLIEPDAVVSFLSEINVITILASIYTRWKVVVSERNDPHVIPKKRQYRFLRRLVYPKADGFVFQTEQAKNYFPKRIQKDSIIIHNPVYPISTVMTESESNYFEIVSIGRLEEQKNFNLLIDAFSLVHNTYPQTRLTIYGEGSKREGIEKQVEELELADSVMMPGNVENIQRKLGQYDMFVLSSNYEGMSNALMEAMSAGLPCISTDCPIGGSSELISDHDNGLLVEVGNVDQLSQAMIEIIEDDKLRNNLGMKAKQINETHSMPVIVQRWEQFLIKTIGKR